MKAIKPESVSEAEQKLQNLSFSSDPQEHLRSCVAREEVVEILSNFYHSEKVDQFGFNQYQLGQMFT